jgi:hypothetical protein
VPARPALFSLLAFLGLVIGSSGAWVSIERARGLLQSRDRFVAAARAAADSKLPPAHARPTAPDSADAGASSTTAVASDTPASSSLFTELFGTLSRDEVLRIVEKQADLVYSRRGVALPMAGMNFILSLLLFAGCARAMRGLAWGASAWSLAAVASIPYELLDVAVAVVQARDLAGAFDGTSGVVVVGSSTLQIGLVALKAAILSVYFVSCAVYLRRPAVRALFTSSEKT